MPDLSDIINQKQLEPEYYDRATLENYAECPFCADAIAKGLVQDGGELADAGNACHEIIADCLKDGMDYEELVDLIPDMARQVRPDIQPRVISSLRGISKAMRWHDPGKIIAVEKQYASELMPAASRRGPVIATSRLDLLVGSQQPRTIICKDWKTGWKHRTNQEAFDAFQTQCAAWLIWKNYETIDTIHFFYVQTVDGTQAYACLERERDFYNFMTRILSTADLALAESAEAWPGAKCAYCPATHICPECTQEPRDFGGDRSAYLGQYIATQGRLDAMKETMKAYCKDGNRHIDYKERVFGYKPPDRKVSYTLYPEKKPRPPKVKKK